MKRPFIFCTSYIDSEYIYENRYKKWYSYYRKKTNLPIFFIDDASTFNLVDTENVNLNVDVCDSVKINFHTFKTHLGRPGDFYVPGWARSFFYSLEIAKKFNFDSIIHLESDFFVLNDFLLNYISNLDSGWTVLWCKKYQMAETSCQIICEDQYNTFVNAEINYRKMVEKYDLPNMTREQIIDLPNPNPVVIEHILPYTHINKIYIGDRYGEENLDIQHDMDFYAQFPVTKNI
jgi:hypothetical protein